MNPVVKEAELIIGCIANKRSAQESLYKLYHKEMWQLCNRYLKFDGLAYEAVNTGFLKVFQHIGSFDERKGGLTGWIKVIMVRTCIDIGRKELQFNKAANLKHEIADIFVSPQILERLYANDLIKLIRMLPAASQMVFNLSVIDGYSHKEISEKLAITEGTSRWHLSEAKKQLRSFLENSEVNNHKPTEKNKRTK
ncbi:RNA polymerase sigma-70 factor, ECF subfamily [Pedobacter steynii]|uniref:RNA polymerase sigma-70 factor, ECF subfamily n=2 Tax=Pedobacter steynii TaxID=430522 RepID=A0A1G9P8D2_9SPHI|nr:sigma-70 family RNA polymerase sigma factor [Pedobacter steynii]NQX39062.1 sigma-70 family RNA polymerase sigma factor [Pedobacter steynii]SDL94964.1 RNA polymerase sigma-70 factor, ECF subfamily [Pedobacter steynii]